MKYLISFELSMKYLISFELCMKSILQLQRDREFGDSLSIWIYVSELDGDKNQSVIHYEVQYIYP